MATHAALWNGGLQDLGTLGGAYSSGYAINANGWVTGYSSLPGETDYHAFLWNGTSLQDIGTLGGNYSFGFAVNASGQVTGYAFGAGNTSF